MPLILLAPNEDGSMVGSCKFSDITVFSFHPVKTITTGEGGIITTNSKKFIRSYSDSEATV